MKRLCLLIPFFIVWMLSAGAAVAYTVTSPEWNFSIDFPATPTLDKTTGQAKNGVKFDQYHWSLSGGGHNFWGVGLIIYHGPIAYNYDTGIKAVVDALKGTLRSDKTIQQDGFSGREILVDLSNNIVLRQRFVWDGTRLYQIIFTSTVSHGTGVYSDSLNPFT